MFLFYLIIQNSVAFSNRERSRYVDAAEYSSKEIVAILNERFLDPESIVATQTEMFFETVCLYLGWFFNHYKSF